MSAKPPLIFVDTNVLVYAHDRSAGEKHRRAADILADLWETNAACISIQVLQEFYVTITQKVPKPLDRRGAKDIVSVLTAWRTHIPDADDIVGAIEIQERFHLSFWDAMIVHSAQRIGCAYLLSEDLNAGQIYGSVQVDNPFHHL